MSTFKPTDVLDLVRLQLAAGGFDGLVNATNECACTADELAPCGQIQGDCVAGHKGPCDPSDCFADGKCDFHIVVGPNPDLVHWFDTAIETCGDTGPMSCTADPLQVTCLLCKIRMQKDAPHV